MIDQAETLSARGLQAPGPGKNEEETGATGRGVAALGDPLGIAVLLTARGIAAA